MKISFTKPTLNTTRVTFVPGTVSQFRNGALTIGSGETAKQSARSMRLLIRKAIKVARENELTDIVISVSDIPNPEKLAPEELGRTFAENALMASYSFTKYKSKEKGVYGGIETLFVEGAEKTFKTGVAVGEVVATEVALCRDRANTPGGDMTPTELARAAKESAKDTPITITVFEKKDAEKFGMGLMLGVDKGSAEPMKFIVMEYWGAGKSSKEKPIVLVGKGITFDTGGINLKPTEGILGMNQDMSGGAAVIAAISAVARLKLKKNVVALIPAVENAVSGSAYRPGDVLVSMSGKTVEVLNTDAEGRLVLSDALTYAERYSPRLVIDVATLTGAALVVAGKRASVVMTRNKELETTLQTLGEKSGEYVIPLPLWEEYEADLKSNVADIANVNGVGASAKAGAGCIQGGIFLSHFAKNFPAWAHIDIAPRMESIPDDNLAPGAVGAPVRLLVRLIEEY